MFSFYQSSCSSSSPASHDTTAKTRTPFALCTVAPDVALRERLVGLPAAMVDLLFCPLRSFEAASAAGVVDDRLTAAAQLVREGKLHAPTEWAPHGPVAIEHGLQPGRQVYAALCLRVNALEAMCRGMRQWQTQTESSSETAELDGLSHHAHLWLDAHMLLCCAITAAGLCPDDNSAGMKALLDAYEPSAATCFHEGELPNVLDRVEQCSFFGGTGDTTRGNRDAITHLFSKAVPYRCMVRDVISILETNCRENAGMFCFFQSILAASLLGVYRHARRRPALAERMRLYHFFFFDPPQPVAAFIEAAHRNRGVAASRLAVFWRTFSPGMVTAAAAGSTALHDTQTESHIRRNLLTAWLSATQTGSGSGGSAAPGKKRYQHQNTVVNVVREYLVFALTFLPHVHEELCARADWPSWQNTVTECLDAMRGAPPGQCICKDVNDALLPSKALYQVEREPFVYAVARACESFLDAGLSGSDAAAGDGSQQPLDAPFPAEFDVLLRRSLQAYPPSVTELVPVHGQPDGSATRDTIAREYLDHGFYPLQVFYGSRSVIREYRAAAKTYAESPSADIATGLVRFLSMTSMYQLQLVHAFAQAVIDRFAIRAFPLPVHLARQQVTAVQKRLGIATDKPCPWHVLTTFVCRVCRAFRGKLVPDVSSMDEKKAGDVPPFGTELVCFAHTSLERQADELFRQGNLPSWPDLLEQGRQHGTLFAWYRAHAVIDHDTAVYPPDPSVYTAKANDLVEARAWVAAVEAEVVPPFAPAGPDEELPPLIDVPAPALALQPWFQNATLTPPPPLPTPEQAMQRVSDAAVVREWERLMGRPTIKGHWAPEAPSSCVIWTCASKSFKDVDRKTRQIEAMRFKAQDNITARARAAAQRKVQTKQRRDMRACYRLSLCNRTQVLECNMLGWAVRVDNDVYVACCRCTAYTSVANARWHGDALVCGRCWFIAVQKQNDHNFAASLTGSSGCIQCRECKRQAAVGEAFKRTTAINEATMTFVDVYFCPKDARKRSWLFSSATYHTVAAVDRFIRAGWTSLKAWNPDHDYARDAAATDANNRMERDLLNLVREHMGNMVIDGQGDDDDDDDEGDDAAADAADANETEKKQRQKRSRKRNMTALRNA